MSTSDITGMLKVFFSVMNQNKVCAVYTQASEFLNVVGRQKSFLPL
jgi:hypothetical protein